MSRSRHPINRREFLKIGAMTAGAGLLPCTPLLAARPDSATKAILKPIPSSNEMLPVIGMGTSRTFDVSPAGGDTQPLLEVLQAFFLGGGALIDSSPMYGNAEQVLGKLLARVPGKDKLFAATKVWTFGEDNGIEQMDQSFRRMGVGRMDLMQVHNLRDWKVQLKTLRDWKERGKIRYLGITTSRVSQYEEFEKVMREEPLDFVQLNYNIRVRDAEQRLLPLAAEKNIAVLVNRPFERGGLFERVGSRPVPAWASDLDCGTWGQFFLKYVVSHPAVTCAIPATSKLRHMTDNMQAGHGRLPDASMRLKMQRYFASL